MPKGPVIDKDIREAIQDLALRGYSTAEIHRRIVEQFPTMPPSDRTVAKYARQVTPHDRSGEWRLANATGEEAAFVLPVLARVLEKTQGRTRHLSVAEAEWIVRLSSAAPDLPPWVAFWLARAYLHAAEVAGDTDLLDRWVAFTPWRNKGERWRKWLPDEPAIVAALAEFEARRASKGPPLPDAGTRRGRERFVEALDAEGLTIGPHVLPGRWTEAGWSDEDEPDDA
jgi:hypothetical protein